MTNDDACSTALKIGAGATIARMEGHVLPIWKDDKLEGRLESIILRKKSSRKPNNFSDRDSGSTK